MVAVLLSLLSAASLGNGAVSGRASLQGVHPIALIGGALVVGFAGVLVASLTVSSADLLGVTRTALPWIVVFGLVQFVIGRSSAYTSLSIVGASRVALFISTQVPFAAFFAVAFTGERLGPLVAVGTVGVIAGLLLASGDSFTQGWRDGPPVSPRVPRRPDGRGGHRREHGAGQAGGERVRLAAGDHGAGHAGGHVHSRSGGGVHRLARNPAVRAFDWKSMGLVAISGLSTTVSIITQLFAVQRADVVIVAPILATFPLWTLLLSHIFIARLEQITLRLTLGTLVTVAGVVAVILGGQL